MSTQDPMHPFLQQDETSPQVNFRPLRTLCSALRLVAAYPKVLLGLCLFVSALFLLPLYLLACCDMFSVGRLLTQKSLGILVLFLMILPVFLFMHAPNKAFDMIKRRGMWTALRYYMRTHFLTRANGRMAIFTFVLWVLSMISLSILDGSLRQAHGPNTKAGSESAAYVSVSKHTTTIYTEHGPKTLERTTTITPSGQHTTEAFYESTGILGVWGFCTLIASLVIFFRLMPFAGQVFSQNPHPVRTAWHLTKGSFWRLFGGILVLNLSLQLLDSLVSGTLYLLPAALTKVLLPIWISLITSFAALVIVLYMLLSHRFFLQYRTSLQLSDLKKAPTSTKKRTPARPVKKASVLKKTPSKKK